MVNPLSRVAMGSFLKDKKPIISHSVNNRPTNTGEKGTNLDSDHVEIIRDLIKGNRDVIENVGKKPVISLDEAADRIKNNR